MVGACVRGPRSGYGVCRVFAVILPHAYLFVASFLFGHSGVILMWVIADDRSVYGGARIDSYVCVSVEIRMRVLRMAIAVVSGWVYGLCMVRGDVVFDKIEADGPCWFR